MAYLLQQLIDSIFQYGKGDQYKIVVLELVPNQYILLDGTHRVCTWDIICKANPNTPKTLDADVLFSSMSWLQAEIISGSLNQLPHKPNTLVDSVNYFMYFSSNYIALLVSQKGKKNDCNG